MKKNILITGVPGVGKTTVIVRLLAALKDFYATGFYTKEIRQGGIRKGFELIDLAGKKSILSHVSVKSPFRVSKYGVDIRGFEEFLDTIAFFDPATDVIVIDEIGKMECLSQKFTTLLEKIMDSEKPLVATIALKGSGIIRRIKERPDVRLFELKPDNREGLLRDVLLLINSW